MDAIATRKTEIEEIEKLLIERFPKFNQTEQRISVGLVRLLALGEPVEHEKLAIELGLSKDEIEKFLKHWSGAYHDEQGRVIGFSGLAISEMKHRFEVDGKHLFTWCAWDSLFLPAVIGKPAKVDSECPVTNTKIQLEVSPDRIHSVKPDGVVMSIITPEKAKLDENIIMHFCHYVFFFKDAEAGKLWTEKNPDTSLVNLGEAFELGQRLIQAKYGTQL